MCLLPLLPACPACLPAGSNVWQRRRRMATALLVFGCVAGVLCTHALVVSIQEEAEVVQLAQASKQAAAAALHCLLA